MWGKQWRQQLFAPINGCLGHHGSPGTQWRPHGNMRHNLVYLNIRLIWLHKLDEHLFTCRSRFESVTYIPLLSIFFLLKIWEGNFYVILHFLYFFSSFSWDLGENLIMRNLNINGHRKRLLNINTKGKCDKKQWEKKSFTRTTLWNSRILNRSTRQLLVFI